MKSSPVRCRTVDLTVASEQSENGFSLLSRAFAVGLSAILASSGAVSARSFIPPEHRYAAAAQPFGA